jgi:hypothetical protein
MDPSHEVESLTKRMRKTLLYADIRKFRSSLRGVDLVTGNDLRVCSHCVWSSVGSDWIRVWGRCWGLGMLVSDLGEVDQRRETGIDIIYPSEIVYRGLTRPAAAKDAYGTATAQQDRMDLPDGSSIASLDDDAAVVSG